MSCSHFKFSQQHQHRLCVWIFRSTGQNNLFLGQVFQFWSIFFFSFTLSHFFFKKLWPWWKIAVKCNVNDANFQVNHSHTHTTEREIERTLCKCEYFIHLMRQKMKTIFEKKKRKIGKKNQTRTDTRRQRFNWNLKKKSSKEVAYFYNNAFHSSKTMETVKTTTKAQHQLKWCYWCLFVILCVAPCVSCSCALVSTVCLCCMCA